MEDLKGFFIPRSIAIFGASSDLNSISGKPLRYLQEHGYKGNVYPINPKYQEVAGLKCYPDLVSLPETPDLLLVAVSYKRIFMVIEQCIEKGVKNIVVFSSGFAEVGGEGVELQIRVVELCREHGIRMLGPNCQGIVSLHDNVTAAFSGSLEINPFLAGGTGFVTQSGALGYSIFNLAQEAGVGFSSVVSTEHFVLDQNISAPPLNYYSQIYLLLQNIVKICKCLNANFSAHCIIIYANFMPFLSKPIKPRQSELQL
jgi:acyl-CoA synthetase (NDP forming)